MENEKFHNMPYARWRTRGVSSVWTGRRAKNKNSSHSPKAEKWGYLTDKIANVCPRV
jgi:hypothetical protein